MLLQREFLLAPRSATSGQGHASSTVSFLINKVIAFPLNLIPILIRHGGDFRRVLFNDTMILSGGYKAEYGPWLNGVAQFSYEAVRNDQMNPKQQRGSYFGALKVGDPSSSDTMIPTPCMSAWQLTISSDDPKHQRVRDILHSAAPGLKANKANKKESPPLLVLSAAIKASNIEDITSAQLVPIVGMNVFNRIFGELKDNEWEDELAELMGEFGDIGALCAVGIKTSGWKRVGDVVDMVAKRIDATTVGKEIRRQAESGKPFIDGDSFINMLSFGFLFAGQGGTSHLTKSSLARIRSDPKKYTPMWNKSPRNFLLEQARIDPPVTSYTSLVDKDTTTKIMGKTMLIPKGTERQMFIVTANRDPSVFALPYLFNPDRTNLNKVLSWNAPVENVGISIAATPRGCPGHSVSLEVAIQIINQFRPKEFDDDKYMPQKEL